MEICFDCFSGVSGDMLIGALLDINADENYLKKCLKSLKIDNFSLNIKKFIKNNYNVTDFDVQLNEDNHDHDEEYLKGNKSFPKIKVSRNLDSVKEIIDNSILSKRAKELSKKIFEIVACAEAKAHEIDVKDVVFHETGAMDSIIDIVSFVVCLDNLNVDKVYAKNLCEGHGEINTRVGKLPIPTPAVKNVLNEYDLTLKNLDVPYELITPTGIACLSAVAEFKDIDKMPIKIGYGNGKRNYNMPCVLKVEVYN